MSKSIDALWAKLMAGEPEVDESATITSSDVNLASNPIEVAQDDLVAAHVASDQERIEAARTGLRDAMENDYRARQAAYTPPPMPVHPAPDPDVEELVSLMIEADKTADSPTVFTVWHHYAEHILSAGYRKP